MSLYIHKYNVSLNKTVTKLCTNLTKCFFFHISTLQATLKGNPHYYFKK